jgi:hypothetical protein
MRGCTAALALVLPGSILAFLLDDWLKGTGAIWAGLGSMIYLVSFGMAMEVTSGKSTLKGYLRIERESPLQFLKSLPWNLFLGALSFVSFFGILISAAVVELSLNYYSDPNVLLPTIVLLTVGQAGVVSLSIVLGDLLWPKSWGGVRVIGCQLALTAAMIFGVIFSTLYWNQSVALNVVFSGPQFDEDGKLVVAVESRRSFRCEERHWLSLNPDGSWQKLGRLRKVRSEAPYQFWTEYEGTAYQTGVTGPETDLVFHPGDRGFQPSELDGIIYSRHDEGWVWRRGSQEHTFPADYRFVWFAQGYFFFRLKDGKGLVAISSETFEEERILDGDADFTVTKNGVLFAEADETIHYSLLTKTRRKLKQIDAAWDLRFAQYSPSREKLLFDLEQNRAVLFDIETFTSVELTFPDDEWDLAWLSDDLIGGDRGFYSLKAGRWIEIEKASQYGLTLDPTGQFLYGRDGRSTFHRYDLNGRLLETFEVD